MARRYTTDRLRRHWMVAAILSFALLSACTEPAPAEFTQCIRPLGSADRGGYFRDEERRCVGQRWRIPRDFYSRKYVAYGPIAEAFVMRLPPRLATDASEVYDVTSELTVMPMFSSAEGYIDRIVADQVRGMRLVESPSPWPELRVWKGRAGDSTEVQVVAPDGSYARYEARCLLHDGMAPERRDRVHCKVRSVLNDNAYVSYTVPFGRLHQLPSVHNSIVGRLSAFMEPALSASPVYPPPDTPP